MEDQLIFGKWFRIKGIFMMLMLPGENTLILSHKAMRVLVQEALRSKFEDYSGTMRVTKIMQQHREPYKFAIELTQDKKISEPPHV